MSQHRGIRAIRLRVQQPAAGRVADQAAQVQAALGDRAPRPYRYRATAAQRLVHRALGAHLQPPVGIVQHREQSQRGRLVGARLDSGEFGTVLRSKGFFRLATRPDVIGLWSQAGAVARFEPAADAEASAESGESARYAQELVFIGTELRPDALRQALSDCLLTAEESRPAAEHDPFPAWDTHHHVEQDHHLHPVA